MIRLAACSLRSHGADKVRFTDEHTVRCPDFNPLAARPACLGTAVPRPWPTGREWEVRPGTALPTEPVLCETFGVSRTVIRETLKVLEEKGLVRVKQGQGTTVTSPEEWDLLDPVVLDDAIRNDESLNILDDLIECA